MPVVTPPITESDPRLTQVEYIDNQWCPVEFSSDGWRISERHKNLKETTKQAVVALWEQGHEEAAYAIANCGKRGSVYRRCKKGNKARAHRHTCHTWICDYCGRPENLLHCWLRTRHYEVRTERQHGIEFRGPLNSDLTHIVDGIARWLKSKQLPNVRRLGIEAKPRYQFIRMVICTPKIPFGEIAAYFHKVTENIPGYYIQSHYESSPALTLKWMFAATASVLNNCGHSRARLWTKYYRKQLMRTAGAFYAPTKDKKSKGEEPEFAELEEPSPIGRECDCGECDGTMEEIPWGQRTVQSVEAIEEEYKGRVDWSGCHDPFHVRRMKSNANVMLNSAMAYMVPPTAHPVAPSPPS